MEIVEHVDVTETDLDTGLWLMADDLGITTLFDADLGVIYQQAPIAQRGEGATDEWSSWFVEWTSGRRYPAIALRGAAVGGTAAFEVTDPHGEIEQRTSRRLAHIARVYLPTAEGVEVDHRPDLVGLMAALAAFEVVVTTDRGEVLVVSAEEGSALHTIVWYQATGVKPRRWHGRPLVLWRWSTPRLGQRWTFFHDDESGADVRRNTVGHVSAVRVIRL